jgi:DNA-binding transcriptional regulator GbsR (MarR family)
MYKSIQEEIIDLLNVSAIPLTTKQISNYFGFSHRGVSTALSKMLATGTAKKYIKKTKGGWNPCYTCDLSGIDVTSLYKIIKSDIKDIKSISRPKTINIKDRSIVTESIDDKIKVNVPFKLVKDMEDLIKEQHERVTELKQKLAEMFDENSTLVTQNKILNERVTNQVDFDIDLSKYQDNLLQ